MGSSSLKFGLIVAQAHVEDSGLADQSSILSFNGRHAEIKASFRLLWVFCGLRQSVSPETCGHWESWFVLSFIMKKMKSRKKCLMGVALSSQLLVSLSLVLSLITCSADSKKGYSCILYGVQQWLPTSSADLVVFSTFLTQIFETPFVDFTEATECYT